jgi:hypothetical protein
MIRMLRQSRSLLLPLTCILPPIVAYTLHKNENSRDIRPEEVSRSHHMLASLLPSPPPDFNTAPRVEHQRQGQHHLRNIIQNGGATLLPKLLDTNDLKIWNANLQAAFADKKGNKYVRCDRNLQAASTDKKGNGNQRIRLHSHQESSKAPYNSHFLNLVASNPELQSFIKSYFDQYSIERYKLTQVQFLLAQPGSEHQIWHRDNIAPGLTLIIALKDVKGNGPTELQLGSHLDNFNIFNDHDEVLLGCLTAGDALLYDARMIHRGRGYPLFAVGGGDGGEEHPERPVLILRWDSLSTPPPGTGLIVTNINACLGSVRMFVTEVQDLVQWLLGGGSKRN